jgi:hypothetical protein
MKNPAIAVAATIAAVGALAAPAAAKPKSATFKLTIQGEQLTKWKYDKQQAPSCDWPENEIGQQYIEFETPDFGKSKNTKVKVTRAKGGGATFEQLRNDYVLTAHAEAERDYRIMYSLMSDCGPDPGPFGGGDPPADAIGSARCDVYGEVDLYLGATIEEVESPYYQTELRDQKPPKAPIYFAADPWWGFGFGDQNLPAVCTEAGQPNAQIGIGESQGEWAGAIIPAAGSLPAKKLLNGKAKKATVEVGRTVKYPNSIQTWGGPEITTGTTRMDATLTFKRVRG